MKDSMFDRLLVAGIFLGVLIGLLIAQRSFSDEPLPTPVYAYMPDGTVLVGSTVLDSDDIVACFANMRTQQTYCLKAIEIFIGEDGEKSLVTVPVNFPIGDNDAGE